MRVLLANKFYYNRGGDCIITLATEQLLKSKGHTVSIFSMHHPYNFDTEWNSFFASSIDFSQKNIIKRIKATKRIFGDKEVEQKFTRLIEEFKPDVIHLHNIHSQLSPSIGEIANKKGIKIVWTLHDYKLICPSYSCLRNNQPCELCIHNGPYEVLRHRCMKNSFPASVLAYLEAKKWNIKKLESQTDYFICPSHFLSEKLIEGGISSSKIKVVPNFTIRNMTNTIVNKEDYYCYVGRLSYEKGIKTLIEAAKALPYKLLIVGNGPLEKELDHSNSNIHFIGFKEWNELKEIVSKARFIVLPSEGYEIFGLVSIEAQCLGTPVLGANIGGIPETIASKDNGLLFKSGDVEDLKKGIQAMFNKEFDYTSISNSAREMFSAENYYNKIIKIYEQ